MRKLMNYIMLSCKKATELIEKEDVTSLSYIENIQLSIHTAICRACRSYKIQSSVLNKAFAKWFSQKEPPIQPLSKSVKKRIKEELEK